LQTPSTLVEEIASTEEFLGISFQTISKDSYQFVHNGQCSYVEEPDEQQIDYCLMGMWQLLSLGKSKDEWSCWKIIERWCVYWLQHITLDNGVVTV